MWLDSDNVMHTIALPDSRVLLSTRTLHTLGALTQKQRVQFDDALEECRQAVADLLESREGLTRLRAASHPDATLPAGLDGAGFRSPEEVLAWVSTVPLTWRLEVADQLTDFVDDLDD